MADIQFPTAAAAAFNPGSAFQNYLNIYNQYTQQNPNATPEERSVNQTFAGLTALRQQEEEASARAEQRTEERQLRQAKERQKLGEESTKKALLYSMLAKLPEQIANAASPYGGPVGAAMVNQGMAQIPGIFSETMRSTPQMNISFPGSSVSQFRYFN